jgi:predicted nucleotide-binding protein
VDVHQEASAILVTALLAALAARPLDPGLSDSELRMVALESGVSSPVFEEVMAEDAWSRREKNAQGRFSANALELVMVQSKGQGYPESLVHMDSVGHVLTAFHSLERQSGKKPPKNVEALRVLCPDDSQQHFEQALAFLEVHGHIKRHGAGFVRVFDFTTDASGFGRTVRTHPSEELLREMIPLVEKAFASRGSTAEELSPGERIALETLIKLQLNGQNPSVTARDIRKRIPGGAESQRSTIDSLVAKKLVTIIGAYPNDQCRVGLRGLLASSEGPIAAKWTGAILRFLAKKLRDEDNVVRYTWRELQNALAQELGVRADQRDWVVQLIDAAGLSQSGGSLGSADDWYWSLPREPERVVQLGSAEELLAFQERYEEGAAPGIAAVPRSTAVQAKELPTMPRKVFIVHGANHGVRDRIDLFLTKELGLETVIMEEKAHGGRTLPEKFEEHASECGFAVFILTADDVVNDTKGKTLRRARQNVILEVGYFWAKLGRRDRIAVLVEDEMDLPSDLQGLGRIGITSDLGTTKERLRKELTAAGILPLA